MLPRQPPDFLTRVALLLIVAATANMPAEFHQYTMSHRPTMPGPRPERPPKPRRHKRRT
jgi:hypothetical protein